MSGDDFFAPRYDARDIIKHRLQHNNVQNRDSELLEYLPPEQTTPSSSQVSDCFLCRNLAVSLFGFPIILLILYKIYQALWAIPRVSRSPDSCYILVTGCGRGFGNEIVKRLDRMGCHVFAGCRSERGIKELDEETSERCHVIKMDISSDQSIKEALKFVKSKLPPGEGLWGLVNNAGIAGSKGGPPEWNTVEDYQEVMNVNLLGTINVTNTFLPLIKSCQGRIVVISSMYGRLALPVGAPYAITKYAIEGFSDSMRRNLRKYGCGVHIIEPGVFRTNIVSHENMTGMIDLAWDSLPEELKEEFGPEYKEEFKNYVTRTSDAEFFNDIKFVVEAAEQALFCKYARARYVVGNDAKYIFLPLSMLPEWLSDGLMDVVGRPPKPAILKNKSKNN